MREKTSVTHLIQHSEVDGVLESVAITRGEESVVVPASDLHFIALKLQEILALQNR